MEMGHALQRCCIAFVGLIVVGIAHSQGTVTTLSNVKDWGSGFNATFQYEVLPADAPLP